MEQPSLLGLTPRRSCRGFAGTPTVVRAAEMRYLGQNYSVDIELDTKKGALTPQV